MALGSPATLYLPYTSLHLPYTYSSASRHRAADRSRVAHPIPPTYPTPTQRQPPPAARRRSPPRLPYTPSVAAPPVSPSPAPTRPLTARPFCLPVPAPGAPWGRPSTHAPRRPRPRAHAARPSPATNHSPQKGRRAPSAPSLARLPYTYTVAGRGPPPRHATPAQVHPAYPVPPRDEARFDPLVLKLQYANYRGALRAPRRNRLLRR
ncbi:hypothetical protein HRG_012901 [Hirsutella rhossiliensis]